MPIDYRDTDVKEQPLCDRDSWIMWGIRLYSARNYIPASYINHHGDVIMVQWRLKSSSTSRLFTQPFIQAQIKGNMKAPRHWPLYGEFTGDQWIPRTKYQLRGKCIHWWRHHASSFDIFLLGIQFVLYSWQWFRRHVKCDLTRSNKTSFRWIEVFMGLIAHD